MSLEFSSFLFSTFAKYYFFSHEINTSVKTIRVDHIFLSVFSNGNNEASECDFLGFDTVQSCRQRQHVSLKWQNPLTNLFGGTTQKTTFFRVTTLKALELIIMMELLNLHLFLFYYIQGMCCQTFLEQVCIFNCKLPVIYLHTPRM